MKPQNSRANNEIFRNNYRQSLMIAPSELTRYSISTDFIHQTLYRESVGLPSRTRASLLPESAVQLLQGIQRQQREREKIQISNLKSSLEELGKKINKAKKQLTNGRNIISEEDCDQEQEGNDAELWGTPMKFQDATTVGSSVCKLGSIQSEVDFRSLPKIKTYYLSHIVPALEGKNKRALDHLSMSMKILRNYYKIQSPTMADLEEKKVNLIREKADIGKKTLILDIDQTLLHCEQDSSKPCDLVLPIEVQNGSIAQAYITIRPYAISFLKRMAKNFELIAFTASHESYADVVLDQIDPGRELIKHRLYRKNCIEVHEHIFVKDLRIINRDLSSMVLVDNASYSYIFQLENGIPILPYYSGEDSQLVQLQKYLEELAKCSDVREFNKKRFKFHKYCNFTDLEEMVRELYLN